MALTRSLLNDFRPLFRLMEDPFFAPTFTRVRPVAWRPSVIQRQTPIELSQEEGHVIVRAEVPGVQKEHLNVHLGQDGQSLTIEGRVQRSGQPKGITQTSESAADASQSLESGMQPLLTATLLVTSLTFRFV